MNGKLEYRRFQPGDESSLSDLYQEVFGKARSAEYWKWKYYRNPAGEHMAYVAVADGKIVGEIATIPVRAKLGAHEVLVSQTCDIVIDPRFRKGTPLFRLYKLSAAENIQRGVQFVYGFSIKTTYRISTKMLGFIGVGPIRKLTKILNPTLFLQRAVKVEWLSKSLGALGAIGLKWVEKPSLKPILGVEIKEVAHFDAAFDELWRTRANDYEIMMVRDAGYLNWRYATNPAETYATFAAIRNGALSGFVVVSLRRQEIKRGHIVELLAPPGDEELIRGLLTYAMDYFYRQGTDNVTAWFLEHTPAFRILRQMRFMVRDTPRDLIVRSHCDIENDRLTDIPSWFISMGDTDHY